MPDTGAIYPGTCAQEAVSPEDDEIWSGPGNIGADDSSYAYIYRTVDWSGTYSYRLKATNFGFSIPTGAIINGIKVEIFRRNVYNTSTDVRDYRVQLLNASGALVGNNKADTATNYPSSFTTKEYGGAADTWGASPTPTMVNDADFGVVLSCKCYVLNGYPSVDYIRMTIYYTVVTQQSKTYTADALFSRLGISKGLNIDALIQLPGIMKVLDADTLLKLESIVKSFTTDVLFGTMEQKSKTFNSDVLFQLADIQVQITSDLLLSALDKSSTITADTVIALVNVAKQLTADALLRALDEAVAAESDALFLLKNITKALTADVLIELTDQVAGITADTILTKIGTQEISVDVLVKILDETAALTAHVFFQLNNQVASITADAILTPPPGWLIGWPYRKYFTVEAEGSIAGTVSVTNGSPTVTGLGTSFKEWGKGDKIQLPDENWYTISDIASNTSLTISENYPGANASGETYDMRLINYQFPFKVYYGSGTDGTEGIEGITGGKVYLAGKCKSDFSDIRIATSDGQTLCSIWLEKKVDEDYAIFWAKFSIVGTVGSKYYIYYGNSEASSGSSGSDTFIKFDDFERGEDEDPIGGDWTVVTATVEISTEQSYGGTRCAKWKGNTLAEATIPVNASDDIAVRMRVRKELDSNLSWKQGDGTRSWWIAFLASADLKYRIDSGWIDTGANGIVNAWQLSEACGFKWASPYNYDWWWNGSKIASDISFYSVAYSPNKVTIRVDTAGSFTYDFYIDDFIVRNFRETEPAWGSWGAEEAQKWKTYTADALFSRLNISQGIDLDTLIQLRDITRTVDADALLGLIDRSKTLVSDALFKLASIQLQITADLLLMALDKSATINTDMLIALITIAKQITADALLKALDETAAVSADTSLQLQNIVKTLAADVMLELINQVASITADTILMLRQQTSIEADACFKALNLIKALSADTLIELQDLPADVLADLVLMLRRSEALSTDIILMARQIAQVQSDLLLKANDIIASVNTDAMFSIAKTSAVLSDMLVQARDISTATGSDMLLALLDIQKTFASDTVLQIGQTKTLSADALLRLCNLLSHVHSDVLISGQALKTLSCDAIFMFSPWRILSPVRVQGRARLLPSVREEEAL